MTLNGEWTPPEEYFLDDHAQDAMDLVLEVGDRIVTPDVPYSFPLTAFVFVEVEEDGTAILWDAEEAEDFAWAS